MDELLIGSLILYKLIAIIFVVNCLVELSFFMFYSY